MNQGKNKAILVFLLAAALLSGSIAFSGKHVNAAPNIAVILNGSPLTFEVQPQILADSVVVPFRRICEAMGAQVSYVDSERKVTMLLNGKYIIMYLDNPIMTYGTYIIDAGGTMRTQTTSSLVLPVPPTIINNYTLVPLRAVSEGLGAKVEWNDPIKTVFITAAPTQAPVTPTPMPIQTPNLFGYQYPTPTPYMFVTPYPTPVPTPVSTPFANTQFFEEISPRRAQSMYDSNEKFILVYYSSNDTNSKDFVPTIKQTAAEQGRKVYGVNVSDPYYDVDTNRLNFIWGYIRYNEVTYPMMFFVHGINNVTTFSAATSKPAIDEKVVQFWRGMLPASTMTPSNYPYGTYFPYLTPTPTPYNPYFTPTPTPYPYYTYNPYYPYYPYFTPTPTPFNPYYPYYPYYPYFTPTPTPTQTPIPNALCVPINYSQAQTLYDNKYKFVMVLYDSVVSATNPDPNYYLNIIKTSINQANKYVYLTDINDYRAVANAPEWWGKSEMGICQTPTVFFVNNGYVQNRLQRPTDTTTIINTITTFLP